MTGRRLLFVALAVSLLELAFLASMIASRAAILRDGVDVTLDVEPVDPRDLLRGDYVVLGYPMSSLNAALAPQGAEEGQTIFVRLERSEDGSFRPIAAALNAPLPTPPGAGQVDIRGIVRHASFEGVRVVYGIERFYVPEGEGRGIEEAMRDDRFQIVAAIGADGSAQIRALLHEGKTVYSEPLF